MRVEWNLLLAVFCWANDAAHGFQGHQRHQSSHNNQINSSRNFVVLQRRPPPVFSHHKVSRTFRIRLQGTTQDRDASVSSGEEVNGASSSRDQHHGTTMQRSIMEMETFHSKNIEEEEPTSVKASWSYWSTGSQLVQAGAVGATTGLLVAIFKLSIESVRSACYEQDLWVTYPKLLFVVPTLGGILVGMLLWLGGPFPPGLRGTLQEVDDSQTKDSESNVTDQIQIQGKFMRKSSAAVVTLGTGCSLGPEGPCVEIGMNSARSCLQVIRGRTDDLADMHAQQSWNRILLSSGAAAGVAAGFNAPIAGVFFALEIMQNAFESIDGQKKDSEDNSQLPLSFTTNTSITPILIASVLSALISQSILGNHLIFKAARGVFIETPLAELPLYFMLGAMSGLVSFAFSYLAKVSQSFFAGEYGADPVRKVMSSMPDPFKPAIGGLLCGIVGLYYPQILFFGYETLNPLLKTQAYLPVTLILTLLGMKTLMTAISAGSGLVGGTFAPSLFLGSMTGAAFRHGASEMVKAMNSVDPTVHPVASYVLQTIPFPEFQLATAPAYAMVGAASVLAALFRAPLTATLLLFEVTRNYDVLLPIMASAGVASIVSDILEDTLERRDEMKRRDKDSVSWGDLAGDVKGTGPVPMARPVSSLVDEMTSSDSS
ncbi:chloride channel [Nitzschia inconspicua]|uniref:Chloride channel n=1 Tax=Nitzschia inconspicua TaxID=303405 RepID=A0A9K3KUW3_9STRA|nr:chloride channel [Nitzschia inconspicua]